MPKLSEFEAARCLDLALAKLREANKLLGEIGRRLEQKHGERKAACEKKRKLFNRLRNSSKKYRAKFVERDIAVSVPFQIREMRERAGLTQQELAELTQKRQSVISQIENPGYGKLTLKTLRTIAEAFDVALLVRFVPFSELVGRAVDVSESEHRVPDIENDHPPFESESTSTERGYLDAGFTTRALAPCRRPVD